MDTLAKFDKFRYSCGVRVVKEMDLKSIGFYPHRFESCASEYEIDRVNFGRSWYRERLRDIVSEPISLRVRRRAGLRARLAIGSAPIITPLNLSINKKATNCVCHLYVKNDDVNLLVFIQNDRVIAPVVSSFVV
ncbi:unnamed protein product [Leptosia nina]|uniref:Uncharacterized protein n=1 Tax=Leptosia nina TaxID=320188 RepID=A0AAV1K1U1_9NEOP